MSKQQKPRKITVRRVVVAAVLSAAIALGMLLRGCLGIGMGPGDGAGEHDKQALVELTDANVTQDAGKPPRASCQLRLSSKGLFLDDQPIATNAAVRTCRDAKEVELQVTGGARSGTFDEIEKAFAAADIELEVIRVRAD